MPGTSLSAAPPGRFASAASATAQILKNALYSEFYVVNSRPPPPPGALAYQPQCCVYFVIGDSQNQKLARPGGAELVSTEETTSLPPSLPPYPSVSTAELFSPSSTSAPPPPHPRNLSHRPSSSLLLPPASLTSPPSSSSGTSTSACRSGPQLGVRHISYWRRERRTKPPLAGAHSAARMS